MSRQITEVNDISFTSVQSQVYDLQIFASGFESRCTAVPKLLRKGLSTSTLVLGFNEHRDNSVRRAADEFYRTEFDCEPQLVPSGLPGNIASLMDRHFKDVEECRILVDVSSMSRSWYADLINWARFTSSISRVRVDFTYKSGIYPDPYPPRAISEITSLFGFEGRSDLRLETVALIGLGYDAITPHAVLEDLQPELTYGYIASGGDELSMQNALKLNSATIEELDGPVAVIPLLSVEHAFAMLGDMIAPHAGNRNVVLVSLGPKTHVLASLLVAARNDEVTCLHVRGRSINATDIKPAREIAACSVIFEHRRNNISASTVAAEFA